MQTVSQSNVTDVQVKNHFYYLLFSEELGKLDNFYDYEKSFDAIWQDLGRMYLERSLQEKTSDSNDRRKKKL